MENLKAKERIILTTLFSSVFLYVLIRTAWISDDAGITIRTVLNFINGYGIKFNIDERVQAFTHPLWLIIISFFSLFIENTFYVVYFISIALSLMTIVMIQSMAITTYNLIIVAIGMILSIAFIDFSTSGLENSLSHFLLTMIFYLGFELNKGNASNQKITIFLIFFSLLYLNRQDLIILASPFIIYSIYINNIKNRKYIIIFTIGFIPIILWFIFSLFYYGYIFPNTAFAKLGAGITYYSKLNQGLNYIKHQILYDPLTFIIIITGFTLGLFNNLGKSISLGIILYLIYVIYIGGDFMEGRFFTAPFIFSILIISKAKINSHVSIAAIVTLVIVGLLGINRTILSPLDYFDDRITENGIASERGFYFRSQGLLNNNFANFSSSKWNISERNVTVTCGRLGFKGIESGPGTHIIDTCALADPLLSRLPAIIGPLRIGHFIRALPEGYVESVSNSDNLITNEKIRSLYEKIGIVTRSNLISVERIKTILELNLNLKELPSYSYFKNIINLNEKINFKIKSKGQTFLQHGLKEDLKNNGWAMPEDWGVWSIGNKARLSLPIPVSDKPKTLEIEIQYLLTKDNAPLNFELYLHQGNSNDGDYSRYNNGKYLLNKKLSIATTEDIEIKSDVISIEIDDKILKEGFINLEFRVQNPFRPKDINNIINNDERLLSIGLKSAVFK